MGLLALIFVPPLTDFSKDPDMVDGQVATWSADLAIYSETACLGGGVGRFRAFHRSYCESPGNGVMLFSLNVFAGSEYTSSGIRSARVGGRALEKACKYAL